MVSLDHRSSESGPPDVAAVSAYLEHLQETICAGLEELDGKTRFRREEIPRPGGGVSRPRVLEGEGAFEKAAVHYTHTQGREMPAAATQRRPDLEGRTYEALSTSLIVHPRNPYVPTCHANFRFFVAHASEAREESVWWFGGGFDCTPYYGFEEDAVHWHRVAKAACDPHSLEFYPRFKQACDRYFYLPHRDEPRGIGGIFYDDFDEGGFDAAFAFWRDSGSAFLDAYAPIVRRRVEHPYGENERDFQLYRRGRYVEFNLLQDRGTRFGLESGARTESVLASLPPLVSWRYDWSPSPGSPEEKLYRDFLRPRDWAEESPA